MGPKLKGGRVVASGSRSVDMFMVESYWPGVTTEAFAEADTRAKEAAAELSSQGTGARYLDSILVPEDESVFYVVQGGSAEVAAELARRAEIRVDRVVRCVRSGRPSRTAD